jgi:hypothetical protein
MTVDQAQLARGGLAGLQAGELLLQLVHLKFELV